MGPLFFQLLIGYLQIPIHSNDRDKIAFYAGYKLYCFKNLSFDLKNAPVIFMRTMHEVLSEYLGKFMMIYIDDVVIFSKTPEEHL